MVGPKCASQVVVGDIPRHPPAWQAREGLTEAVKDALDRDGRAVMCALAGARGVGKTQLAGLIARREIAAGCPLVAWVNAENVHTLQAGLAEIARRLGVAGPEQDSAAAARVLRDHLNTRQEFALLVLDDATDPALVRDHIPATGPVRVLITTNDQAFAALADPVEVGVYARPESVAFLAEGTGIADDPDGADALSRDLGDLPMALAQAAPVVRAKSLTFDRYRQRWAAIPVEQLMRPRDGDPYPRGTAAAVLLSLHAYRDTAVDPEKAQAMVTLIAVLAPDGVHRGLLGDPDDPAAGDLDDLLAGALRFGLLTRTGDGDALVMHRLSARVLLDHATATDTLTRALTTAVDLIRKHTSDDATRMRQHRQDLQMLPDQIDAIWAAGRQNWTSAPDQLTQGVFGLRQWALDYLIATAGLTRARTSGTDLLTDLRQHLGPDHPATRYGQDRLARAHELAGDLSRAIPLYEATLADSQRMLGPDHPNTLSSRNNLAGAYESAGELSRAIPLYEATLADSQQVLGPDHPNTLSSRNNLAYAYRAAGDLDRAIPLYETTLAGSQWLLGPDHPNTLTSRNNLASAYWAAGDLDRAIPLYETTLAESQRMLGPDHPTTRIIRNNLNSAVGRPDGPSG